MELQFLYRYLRRAEVEFSTPGLYVYELLMDGSTVASMDVGPPPCSCSVFLAGPWVVSPPVGGRALGGVAPSRRQGPRWRRPRSACQSPPNPLPVPSAPRRGQRRGTLAF
jgi:hypothetical protein